RQSSILKTFAVGTAIFGLTGCGSLAQEWAEGDRRAVQQQLDRLNSVSESQEEKLPAKANEVIEAKKETPQK
ncbi:MAG: hypothetical protein K2Z81_20415, partial [Cyanobacteria bacterium]|nr:hypothetical protein [Cyanobacteriota bacterium]